MEMKMHYLNPMKKNPHFQILKLFFFAPFLLLFACESSSQKESKLVLSKNPWLKPFIFNAPKIVSKTTDSTTNRHFTRISFWYEKDPRNGQKLFPRIDSAAKADGWIETDIRAGDKFIDNKTYWKNWHGENGISGQYNLIIWCCIVNAIIFDLQFMTSLKGKQKTLWGFLNRLRPLAVGSWKTLLLDSSFSFYPPPLRG